MTDRLTKIISMFGSPYEGERNAAFAKACDIVAAEFGDWSTLLEAARRGRQFHERRVRNANPPSVSLRNHQRLAFDLLAEPEALTDWERKFLANIARLPRISAKQSATLQNIRQRVRGVSA